MTYNTYDYGKTQRFVIKMLTKYGRPYTFQKLGNVPDDTDKPWNSSVNPVITEEVQDVPLIILPMTDVSIVSMGLKLSEVEMFKSFKQVALCLDKEDKHLEHFHHIIDPDGVKWRLEKTHVLRPSDRACLYIMGLA